MKTRSYSWYQRRVRYLNLLLGDNQSAKAIRDAQLEYERRGLGYTPDTARLMEYGKDIRYHSPTEAPPPQILDIRWSAYISQNPTAYRIARGGYTYAKPHGTGGAAYMYKTLPDGRVERFDTSTGQIRYIEKMPAGVSKVSMKTLNDALKAEARRTGRRRKSHPFDAYGR